MIDRRPHYWPFHIFLWDCFTSLVCAIVATAIIGTISLVLTIGIAYLLFMP